MRDNLHVAAARTLGIPVIENRYLRVGETLYVKADGAESIHTGSVALFSFQMWAHGQWVETMQSVDMLFSGARHELECHYCRKQAYGW